MWKTHTPEPASGLFGLGLFISAMLIAGCAPIQQPHAPTQPRGKASLSGVGTAEALYLARILTATPAELAGMWHQAKADKSPAGQLHQALIESIENSKFYDRSASIAELKTLRSGRYGAALAAVATVRLAQMSRDAQCKERLKKIVKIENKLAEDPP